MIQYFLEHNRYLNLIGIVLILALAYLVSARRQAINKKLVFNALFLQAVLGFLTLKVFWGQAIIRGLASGITNLYEYAEEGARFVFGSLSSVQQPWGFIFAFRVLPIIIFFSALIALLFHYNIIQRVTAPLTKGLYYLLGTSAAETLCAVANSFLGQTEAPLLITRYLSSMTKSEILTVMVSGMGSLSGPLFAVYAAMGVSVTYLLSASIMAIPSTILISKILMPETEEPKTLNGLSTQKSQDEGSLFDALATGTSDGLKLALAVAAMLIAFIALIAGVNGLLGGLSNALTWLASLFGASIHLPQLTLQTIFGYLFAPLGWILGLSGSEITRAGELLGLKLTVNELVAYAAMVSHPLSARATALLTFALAGFANLSSIGIQVAGIGCLAPNKQKILSSLGFRAVLGGSLSNLLSACIAGLFL